LAITSALLLELFHNNGIITCIHAATKTDGEKS
jgi:hypothetical protein